MKKKAKFLLSMVLVSVLIIASAKVMLASNGNSEESDELSVVIGNDGIEEGKEDWNTFVKESANGNNAVIDIKLQYDMSDTYDENFYEGDILDIFTYNIKLSFDGEYYSYDDGEKTGRYKYLLQLSGQNPGAENSTTDFVLANEKITYEEHFKSTYSSNLNDRKDCYMLFSYIN